MASIKANCRKVVCIGRNYADHITELSSAKPAQPFFFLKPPSCILPPNSGPCIRPSGVSLHYEVELGLVMGKPLKNLAAADEQKAYDAIGAYFLGIDMTARNVQNEAKKKGLPWSIAKGFDTFLPVSEVVSKERIADPHASDVVLWLSVNGEARQRDSTELMLWRIPRMLSDISKVMALEVGDVVLTGTPKGVGEVKGGDVMTAGLEVGGKEIQEGRIEVRVEDASMEKGEEAYVFRET